MKQGMMNVSVKYKYPGSSLKSITCLILPIPNTQEMFLLGYCIALSQCSWQLTFTLRNITDEHFDMFISGLTKKDIQPSYLIEDINASLNPLGNKGIDYLAIMLAPTCIK